MSTALVLVLVGWSFLVGFALGRKYEVSRFLRAIYSKDDE